MWHKLFNLLEFVCCIYINYLNSLLTRNASMKNITFSLINKDILGGITESEPLIISLETSYFLVLSLKTFSSLVHSLETSNFLLFSLETSSSLVHSLETNNFLLFSLETSSSLVHSLETSSSLFYSLELVISCSLVWKLVVPWFIVWN